MKKLMLALTVLLSTGAFAYTVQEGDTVSKLLMNKNCEPLMDHLAIFSSNNPEIDNINMILPGQDINLHECNIIEEKKETIVKKVEKKIVPVKKEEPKKVPKKSLEKDYFMVTIGGYDNNEKGGHAKAYLSAKVSLLQKKLKDGNTLHFLPIGVGINHRAGFAPSISPIAIQKKNTVFGFDVVPNFDDGSKPFFGAFLGITF